MKKILALALAVVLVLSFTACGELKTAKDFAEKVDNALVVAEKGSAGEELATKNDFFAKAEYTAVGSMAKALMEVKAGTADIALVDYVTSIGSIGEGTDFADLVVVEGHDFNPEEYGIAFRKGSDLVPVVNEAISALMNDGTMDGIAEKYKLKEQLIKDGKPQDDSYTAGDLAYIKEKGKLTIGITYFAPMSYMNDKNELVGFETEFAKAVCEKLGVEAEFIEINWDSKEIELKGKSIDCIWNGMTINDERLANMSISVPYMNNKQVMVARAAK